MARPGDGSPVTQLLAGIQDGDTSAAAKLLPLVYEDFRALALRHLARTGLQRVSACSRWLRRRRYKSGMQALLHGNTMW